MKRIAVISYHTCPLSAQEGKETGGMNIYILELIKALGEKGYIIDVFTRSQDEKSQKIVQVSENVRVIHIVAGPQKAISKKELSAYIPEFVENFIQFSQNEQTTYDAIDCHYYLSGLIGLKIKDHYKTTIPVIVDFHTLALMKNLVARTEDEKESQERIDAEMLLVEKADVLIAPSCADTDYLKYLYGSNPNKIVVVNRGVNTQQFRPMDKIEAKTMLKADSNEKIILFVGRIEPLKGIDVLMYSIKILLEKNPTLNVCLWIVGGDVSQAVDHWSQELQKLEELRQQLHIKSSVKLIGRKLPEELPYYYNAAEVVVAPSQYESFGMSALEAMACGTPVITTDVTGISEIFDKDLESLIISANNSLSLADQMEYLLTNQKAHEEISKQVLEKAQLFDWEFVAQKFIEIYKKL